MKKNNKIYWNNFYKKIKSSTFWPWSDLISLTSRYVKTNFKNMKVLEIGVGNGANIPFFLQKKCKFYGVDSSDFIIKFLKKRFPTLKKNLFAGNFEDMSISKQKFDLIYDRGAISCGNDQEKITKIIKLINFYLKKNGYFIGVDWYSKNSSYYKDKLKKDKLKNFYAFKTGPFKNLGNIFFSNKKDLLTNFKNFKILHLDEKKTTNNLKKKSHTFSSWNIVVKK
jgi:cyclopropane fatty-acyl-phospholipid synthase-like methyltransferase